MSEAFICRRGGGAALNFKVVGGTSAPASPAANTIWVNTSTTITDWVFSPAQPTAAAGRVWINTGVASNVPANALKKNGIWVYPTGCSQYISGAWEAKNAKTYQNGAWIDWRTYLYTAGDVHSALTGGWHGVARVYTSAGAAPTLVLGAGYMTATQPGGTGSSGAVQTVNPIDLSRYNTLRLNGYASRSESRLNVYDAATGNVHGSAFVNLPTARGTVSIDISSIAGNKWIGISMWTGGVTVYIYEIELV